MILNSYETWARACCADSDYAVASPRLAFRTCPWRESDVVAAH